MAKWILFITVITIFLLFNLYAQSLYTSLNKQPNLQNPISKSIITETKIIHTVIKNYTDSTPLAVYSVCGNTHSSPSLRNIPERALRCDPELNPYHCHETGPYLKFLIDQYDNPLAETYIFMHGHRHAWHYTHDMSNALSMLFQSSYYKEENFGGVQCYWNYAPTMYFTNSNVQQMIQEIFMGTTFLEEFKNETNVSFPCCGTFFVKSDAIRFRPKSDYIAMYENIEKWTRKHKNDQWVRKLPDAICGRVFEMLWNRITAKVKYVKLPPYCRNPHVNKFPLNIDGDVVPSGVQKGGKFLW